MNLDSFRAYCLAKPQVSEDLPFDQNTLCMRVFSKIFAICNLHTFDSINLKCDPKKALELRASYPCVVPGYHMNKKHWNTILLDGSMPDSEIRFWIDHSYELVLDGIPQKLRTQS